MSPVLVGTSGWQYDSWRGVLYPQGLPQRRWLEHYAAEFPVVEVNATFYRLPTSGTFQAWAERTPERFVFCCKLSRFVSHVRRLVDPRPALELFFSRAEPLRPKMGPVLLQLPPTFRRDDERLAATLAAVPDWARVAVEFRHPSWFVDDVAALLSQFGAALVLADRRGRPAGPLWRTAPFGYVRLHEGRATPPPCYGEASLRSWAARLRERWSGAEPVYVFFNNDALGCAVVNARRMATLCGANQVAPAPPTRLLAAQPR